MVSKRYRRATLTAFLLFVCQQLSGINAVVYFSTQIFRDAGVTSAVLSSLLVMLVNVAGTALWPHHSSIAWAHDDAFRIVRGHGVQHGGHGRVPCGTVISSVEINPVRHRAGNDGVKMMLPRRSLARHVAINGDHAPGTVAYVFAFSCGIAPCPRCSCPRRVELRGKGGSVAMLSHWGWNAVVGAAFFTTQITSRSRRSAYTALITALSGLFAVADVFALKCRLALTVPSLLVTRSEGIRG